MLDTLTEPLEFSDRHIERFLRPLCYQDYPDSLLPDALKNANPLGLLRLVDGRSTREALD